MVQQLEAEKIFLMLFDSPSAISMPTTSLILC